VSRGGQIGQPVWAGRTLAFERLHRKRESLVILVPGRHPVSVRILATQIEIIAGPQSTFVAAGIGDADLFDASGRRVGGWHHRGSWYPVCWLAGLGRYLAVDRRGTLAYLPPSGAAEPIGRVTPADIYGAACP
jgi:hypothetical protein